MSKRYLLTVAIVLSFCLAAVGEARGLRAPIIDDSNVVTAKGDIPTPSQYLPAITAYMKTVNNTVMQLEKDVQTIMHQAKNKQLHSAQETYIKAHQHYERIRPVAVLFNQVDQSLNSRADYYIAGVNDPRFVGFHLVEYDLFVLKDLPKAAADGENLLAGVHDLRKRVAVETIQIPKMVQAAADFMEMILDPKLLGMENQYSRSDLADIAANLEGSKQIIHFLHPFIARDSLSKINQGFTAINSIMARYRQKSGQFQPFPALKSADKSKLYSLVTAQAEYLAGLRAELKIDVYFKYK